MTGNWATGACRGKNLRNRACSCVNEGKQQCPKPRSILGIDANESTIGCTVECAKRQNLASRDILRFARFKLLVLIGKLFAAIHALEESPGFL